MASWETRIDRVSTVVQGWQHRLLAPDVPDRGSSLAADDDAFPRMSCSQLAWWGMSVGVEHLDATLRLFNDQVAGGGPILPAANFTVLRAALVGSSQAIVLLAPSKRQERVNYGLQIAHEEYRQVFNFRKRLLEHPGLVLAGREAADRNDYLTRFAANRDEVADLLKARGVAPRLTDTAMIERAAELSHTDPADAQLLQSSVMMEWALGSGAAHGRLLMTMHRQSSFRTEAGDVALFGSTYEQVAMPIVGVFLLLNQAWRVWDLRRRAI